MNYRIFAPEVATSEVSLPASKSISNRALIVNALAGGSVSIFNVAHCDDTDAMVTALNNVAADYINIGAAGTAMRFLTAYFAVQEGREVVLDGSERMRHRPIKILVEALRSCGACIEYIKDEGYPPLRIKGKKLCISSISIPGNVSSQYISALLMIAPLIEGFECMELTENIISLPYIDMTLSLMRNFGISVHRDDNKIVFGKQLKYNPVPYKVENDWSAASYWFQIQSLLPSSYIVLNGLFPESLQGDSAVARLYEVFGVKCMWKDCGIELSEKKFIKCDLLEMNLIENPDLAQTVVVTACLLEQPFKISGLQTLKIKETDRIEALRSQLLKLGYVLTVGEDLSLSWDGTKCEPVHEIRIDTFDDHRMAMAFAPAAVKFPGLIINDTEVVSKSYPEYWNHMLQAGFKLDVVE